MTRREAQEQRDRMAREMEELLKTRTRSFESRVYNALRDILAGLAIDRASRLVFSVRNIATADRVAVQVNAVIQQESKGLFRWIFRRLLSLFNLNRKYFRSFLDRDESVDDKVRRLILRRYGYDVTRDRILPNGLISQIANGTNVAASVGRFLSQALASRLPMNDFRRQFRDMFLNPGGVGMIESHFNRFTRDLFQEFDRGVQNEYKEELGLEYAVYSGTIKDNTRDFCKRRVGNIYTDKEIDSWNDQSWKGKNPNGDVRVVLGGYNCRHHLNWISKELALKMAKRTGGVNNYN